MLWQIGVFGASAYGLYRNTYKEKIAFKKQLREICEKSQGFFNRQMETLKVNEFEVTNYGYKAVVGIPYGLSFEMIEEKKELLTTNLAAREIILERDPKSSMMNLTVINKPFENITFEPMVLKPYEIFLGYTHKEYIKINLNSFPHLLVSGATGTGKSRLMLVILANLISTHKNIDIFMCQIRKGDLIVFEDCKQVKYMAKSLEETAKVLEYLNNLCIERDKQIERYIKRGIYNIQDWNESGKKSMKYNYLILDEFSFYIPSKADNKEVKALKYKCLAYIQNIVLTGRSVGIFLFTSLQRPTKSAIPTEIKAQLNIKVSFKQLDNISSMAILGNGNATGLEIREAIIQTNKEKHIRTPFIDHKILMAAIKPSIEKEHKFINLESSQTAKFKEFNNSRRIYPSESKEGAKQPKLIENKANGIVDLNKIMKGLNNVN